MARKSRKPLSATIKADIVAPKHGRQFRDRLTRVISSPIKGRDTNAKQWSRWTP